MNGFLAALGLCVLAIAPLAAASAQPEPRVGSIPMLSVTGTGRALVAPDMATVRLGVGAQESEAAAAQSRVNQSMQKVLNALAQAGVEKDQIQTSTLSLYPVYTDWGRPQQQQGEEPRIAGYRAEITVSVRLTDLGSIGRIIDAGLTAGANQLHGVAFDLQDDTQAKSEALAQAIRSARTKAQAMADAIGHNLAGLVEVSESEARVIRPMMDYAAEGMAVRAMADGTPVSPGQMQITANVTLRYRLGGPGMAPPPGRIPEPVDQPQRPERRDREP